MIYSNTIDTTEAKYLFAELKRHEFATIPVFKNEKKESQTATLISIRFDLIRLDSI